MDQQDGEHLTVQALIEAFEPRISGVGGSPGFLRNIEGVSVSEEEDPIRWMAPRSLLLTSGMMLRANPENGASLIERLDQAGMTAIGLGMAPYWKEVPAGLIAAADRLAFPVLRISGMRFHEIMAHVFSALSSRRIHMLQRTVSVQHALAELLSKNRGSEELLRSLSDFLDADVLLFDWRGGLLEHSSRVRPSPEAVAGLWRLYESVHSASALAPPKYNQREVHFREVRLADALERVLVAVLQEAKPLDLLADRTLSFARAILETQVLADHDRLGNLRRAREALFLELLRDRGETAELSERLAHYGIMSTEPRRLLVLAAVPPTLQAGGPLSKATRVLLEKGPDVVNAYLESLGGRFLSASQRDCLLVLLGLALEEHQFEARQFAEGFVQQVRQVLHLDGLRAGFSEPFAGVASTAEAFAHARQALQGTASRNDNPSSVVLYEDLGLHFAALNTLPEEYLRRLRARVVEPLLEFDRSKGGHLYETLLSYLAHKRSIADTSRALYLHRNTLRRRLQGIEQILGIDLRDTDNLVEVRMAALASEVLSLRKASRD